MTIPARHYIREAAMRGRRHRRGWWSAWWAVAVAAVMMAVPSWPAAAQESAPLPQGQPQPGQPRQSQQRRPQVPPAEAQSGHENAPGDDEEEDRYEEPRYYQPYFHGLPFVSYEIVGDNTWLDWWEANRALYLRQALELREGEKAGRGRYGASRPEQRAGRGRRQADRQAHYEAAVEALLEATRHEDAMVREGAALALGRLEAERAVPRLLEIAREDRNAVVRRGAWLALGLIGTDEAQAALLEGHAGLDALEEVVVKGKEENWWHARMPFDLDATSRVTALGLLEEPGPEVIRTLAEAIDRRHRSPTAALMAMWALRVQRPPRLRDLSLAVLQSTSQPGLAQRAVLALGEVGDERDVVLLGKLAVAPEQTPPPAIANLDPYDGATGGPFTAWMRASAATALGRLDYRSERTRDTARQALKQSFRRLMSHHSSEIHRGSVLIALGRIGTRADTAFLADVMDAAPPEDEFPRLYKRNGTYDLVMAHDSLRRTRGFAAIAAGLHLRRYPEATERQRNAELYKLAGVLSPADLRSELHEHLLNKRNPSDFRAACALALGLAGLGGAADERGAAAPGAASPYRRPEDIKALMQAAEAAYAASDELLFGHALLALGLLGEPRTVNAAARYLGPAAEELDVEGLIRRRTPRRYRPIGTLGRRTAALGLAALGDERAAPLLIGEWGRNFWVDLEAARALAWSGSYGITDGLIALMRQRQNRVQAVSAVWSLGVLFDAHRPSRLSRLAVGNNHWYVTTFYRAQQAAIPAMDNLRNERLEAALARTAPNTLWPFEYWHTYGNPFMIGHPLFKTVHREINEDFQRVGQREILQRMQRGRVKLEP